MTEPERVEAQAMRDAIALAGGRAQVVGGAVCITHPGSSQPELNRALPIGEVVDAGAIAGWFDGRPHLVSVPPGYLGLEESLQALGYDRGSAWMKFTRGADAAPHSPTDLRIEETLSAEAFAVAFGAGYGLPQGLALQLGAIVGAPGWQCFVAFDHDEPAACGALYADGETGWLGLDATRPEYRRRGAQSAILAARVEAGRARGLRLFATETGERLPDRPDQSYRNILRTGFREAYLRPNWRSPA